jgi:nitric oxide reductase subunit B
MRLSIRSMRHRKAYPRCWASLVLGLHQVFSDADWDCVEQYVKVSFGCLNIGLAGMLVINLYPSWILRLLGMVNHGCWHARGPAFRGKP